MIQYETRLSNGFGFTFSIFFVTSRKNTLLDLLRIDEKKVNGMIMPYLLHRGLERKIEANSLILAHFYIFKV